MVRNELGREAANETPDGLPKSRETLAVLLDEVRSFGNDMRTLALMYARLASLLKDVDREGTPSPATERLLEQQREALARHVTSYKCHGYRFLRHLPSNAVSALAE